MGLFRKSTDDLTDPWTHGVRTKAVVEQISLTGIESGNNSHESFEASVLLRFTDEAGVEQLMQNTVWIGAPRPPGSVVEIAYFPDQLPVSIRLKAHQVGRRDPNVPRGWGAGIFTPAPVGPFGAPQVNHDLDESRELFRAGTPVEAVVTKQHWGMALERHGTTKCTTTVAVAGKEYTASFWAWGECVPDVGEHIKVVIGPDGSTIALDTDESYYGPPGRALVWTTPADLQEIQDNPHGLPAQLAAIDQMVAKGTLTAAQAAVMKDQVNPPPAAAPTTAATQSPILTKQLAAIEMAHKAGNLTDEQYESMRSQLLLNPPD